METSLRAKQNRLILLRFFVTLICLAAIELLNSGAGAEIPGYAYSRYLLALIFAVNILYALATRAWASSAFILAQLLIDSLFISALIFFTGGTSSSFNVLYFFVVVGTSILVGGPLAALTASASTILLSTVTILYLASEQLPAALQRVTLAFPKREVHFTLYYLCMQASGYYLVAFLSGALAERLARQQIVQDEILQGMEEGVLVVGLDGQIHFANRKARELLHIDPMHTAGGDRALDVLTGLPEETRGSLLAMAEEVLDFELRNPPQADPLPVEAAKSFLVDSRGKRRGLLILLKDMRTERELEKIRTTSERLKTVSELSAGIAHEIRNPLASIRGAAQELSGNSDDPEYRQKLMGIILRESDRLNTIISDFLEFAAMRKPRLGRTSLRALLEECILLLRKREDSSQITFTIDYPGTRADDPLYAMVDGEQIRQVILNIAINAIQAMNGKGTLQCFMFRQERFRRIHGEKNDSSSYQRARGISIEIKDSGPGIQEGVRSKLLTPFFTTKPGGTGMGLAIVNRIVADHKGYLTIDSAPGAGCTLSVWLPE